MTNKDRNITFKIMRYRPEVDPEPVFQSYSITCPEEWVVLDALNYIKDNIDSSLSYRWSCHMAVCGSCGMMINGEPMLACKAFLRDIGETVQVEPLSNFPIERDLVIVIDDFMEKMKNAKVYLIHQVDKAVEEGTYLQTPIQLKRYKQYTLCINCLLCYAACPQYALSPDFIGPAVLALTHRYNADSRDEAYSIRHELISSDEGIWQCSFVSACSEVCPKHVDPASAIQQMKIASTKDYFLGFLRGKQ